MFNSLGDALRRLQESFSKRAERAYKQRDAPGTDSQAAAYAEGEGHAYGVASDEVRDAEKDVERPPEDR